METVRVEYDSEESIRARASQLVVGRLPETGVPDPRDKALNLGVAGFPEIDVRVARTATATSIRR